MKTLPYETVVPIQFTAEDRKELTKGLPVEVDDFVCLQLDAGHIAKFNKDVYLERPSGYWTKQELLDKEITNLNYIEFESRYEGQETPIWVMYDATSDNPLDPNPSVYEFFKFNKKSKEFEYKFTVEGHWPSGVIDWSDKVGHYNQYGDGNQWVTEVTISANPEYQHSRDREFVLVTETPLELVEILPYKTGLTIQTTMHFYVLFRGKVKKSFALKCMTEQQKKKYNVKQ